MFICSEEPRAEASAVTDSPPVIKKRKLNSSKDVNEAIVSSLNGLMEFRKLKQQKDEKSLHGRRSRGGWGGLGRPTFSLSQIDNVQATCLPAS